LRVSEEGGGAAERGERSGATYRSEVEGESDLRALRDY
jgi:hypothetical protein